LYFASLIKDVWDIQVKVGVVFHYDSILLLAG